MDLKTAQQTLSPGTKLVFTCPVSNIKENVTFLSWIDRVNGSVWVQAHLSPFEARVATLELFIDDEFDDFLNTTFDLDLDFDVTDGDLIPSSPKCLHTQSTEPMRVAEKSFEAWYYCTKCGELLKKHEA